MEKFLYIRYGYFRYSVSLVFNIIREIANNFYVKIPVIFTKEIEVEKKHKIKT